MTPPGTGEPFETSNVDHDLSEPFKGAGKNARDVGVSTRHAHGVEGEEGEIDAPREVPGRPTFPIGTQRSDDGEPTDAVDFAPRDATPPTMTPDT
ncbi:MAG: hypothetical protein AB7K36_26475 [Chloroflexota bacterium]